MGVKKFLQDLEKTLDFKAKFNKKAKKESMEKLLKKLKIKKEKNQKHIDHNPNKKEKAKLKEEKAILECQIKKGEGILKDLNS
ncbi:MAG: hypothetical protein KAI79_04100 [Bacteroidales bacterium]|nr:hypothetical protein [Bacteroidales bacterium]